MRKLIPLLLVVLLAACSSPVPSQEAPKENVPTATATAATPTPAPTAEETGGPYDGLPVKITIGEPTEARRAVSPVALDLREEITVDVLCELPSAARGMTLVHDKQFAYAGVTTDAGTECIYGGSLDVASGGALEQPLYVAPGDYPHIDSMTGTNGGFYFIEYNDAAWRLLLFDMAKADEAPLLIDHGEGPPPVLASSDGDLVYAAETTDGFELRVWQRRWDEIITSELLGVITLPAESLETDRWFILNQIGVTHSETDKEGILLIAEDLHGIRAALRVPRLLKQATVGSNAVAWLGEDGTFCAYDPEGDKACSFGEDVTWYAPLDSKGEGFGYLFGGKGGLYVMSWDLDAAEPELAAWPLAEGDGWTYTIGAAAVEETQVAYAIREKDGKTELCRIPLGIEL